MPCFKAVLLVIAGASMLVAHPVAAVQRAVQLSAADQAVMDDFWKSCAAPVAEAKKIMASKGEAPSDAEFRGFLNAMPAEMRQGAKFAEMKLDAAYYREAIAQVRKDAADPNNTDPTARFMAPIFVCLLETMIRHDAGGAARTPIEKPSPARPAPVVDPRDGTATDCVEIDTSAGTTYGGLRNVCDFPVYVTYCAFRPAPGSWNESFNCEKQQFGLDGIGAKSTQGAHTKGAEYISVFACQKPKTPSGSRFDGKVIRSTCK